MCAYKVVNTRNRMISQNIYMSLDTRHTDLNNNILVIGGSGAGKTFRFVKPTIMQMSSSFIITDPKGELLRDTAGFLAAYGYKVKVINLLNAAQMKKSSHYNPFCYITSDVDVQKLVTNMMKNTTPKGTTASDPFWDKAESMFLQALFYYVHYHVPKEQQNFRKVMELINKGEVKTDSRGHKVDSELDIIFNELEKRLGPEKAMLDPAVTTYNKVMRGAADTVRCIVLSANARLQCCQSESVLEFFDDDEMDILSFGEEKTVVYCVIPDTDKTFNFVVGMFYEQVFQQLYYSADFIHGGVLPVNVAFLMDEFANVALPDDFCSLLSTMRGRGISSIIIIQNMTQIESLFEKNHKNIPGNCDTLVYLGGNEPDSHKYVSEAMGKATIDKKTSGRTLGEKGSSSQNFDNLGREIMTPDEIRRLPRDKCILLINGQYPVVDQKINALAHPMWRIMCRLSKNYTFDARRERMKRNRKRGETVTVKSRMEVKRLQSAYESALEEYELEKKISQDVKKPERPVYFLSYSQIMNLGMDEEGTIIKREPVQFPDSEYMAENRRKRLTLFRKNKEIEKAIDYEAHREQYEENARKEIVRELAGKEEVMLYGHLFKKGYAIEVIRLLLEFYREMEGEMSAKEICDMVSPEMSMDIVEKLISAIKL